ncbi:MbtH family protein [Halobacillus salinarum]|uniref:MbtH family protein n=1 Tax=Halobacillus salinarum TaxID=2932257 RepID=A0ABY4EKK1_9BACI|nr:MbtH family protein [Halobacillus salinarum]UOQ42596.1 MbtH family protein [Halobacillus salinarum]
MSNPFENEASDYLVLINEEGQYSLWPAFIDVPSGWEIVYGKESRDKCLHFISTNWKDMIPARLKRVEVTTPGK